MSSASESKVPMIDAKVPTRPPILTLAVFREPISHPARMRKNPIRIARIDSPQNLTYRSKVWEMLALRREPRKIAMNPYAKNTLAP